MSEYNPFMSDDEEQESTAARDNHAVAGSDTVQDILSSLFSMQSSGSPQSQRTENTRTISLSGISLQTLGRLLGGRAVVSMEEEDNNDEEDDGNEDAEDDDDEDEYYSSIHRHAHNWFGEVKDPQAAGVALLNSGDFGKVAPKIRKRRDEQNLAKLVLRRSTRPTISAVQKEDYASNLVPNTNGTTVATYDANIYTAQFSDDSSFYYTCSQDFRLHIFDMNAPPVPLSLQRRGGIMPDPSLKTSMAVRKTIQGHPGRWTITDANLSPDNERMIYSSITPTVYMTSTSPDGSSAQIPISFSDTTRRYVRNDIWGSSDSFGIWSCRFSADGNEVVAGGNSNLFVYDLLANRRTVKIVAHSDDVNSCCWADTASGNVLVSASDDTFLKVWDRRSLGTSQKPSGVLIGHTEGITYVSAKGDGRYIISNGKDQALRLWDLRKMRSSLEFDAVEDKFYGVSGFDYRYPHYPKPRYQAHPKDCSVMTYRGHSVLRTLIRCHFSPAETTGSQYLYSGSADGRIHIWSLDGRVVQVLDRAHTLPMSFDPSGPEPEPTSGLHSSNCVRDVSWHSQEPVIISAGWENGRGGSVIARHEWKGLLKMPGAIEDWVERNNQEHAELASERRHSQRLAERARRFGRQLPGSFDSDDL